MALTLGSGIDYQGTENNFARDYFENLADMVAMRSKSLPKMFIAMCGETGKAYLYNKSAEADEALGKWREIPSMEDVGSGSGGAEVEEETDTIDFSTWPEFSPNLDAGGITLDGHGGANVDGSNVSVDPDDIEPDD